MLDADSRCFAYPDDDSNSPGESFIRLEHFVGAENIPLTTLKPVADTIHQDVLIVYGGSIRPGFRRIVKQAWGEPLAHAGLTVHCFDFRSNIPGNKLNDFGIFDRIVDTDRVIEFLLGQPQRNPLTLIGVSMGGYIVAQLLGRAWEGEISKLTLVAPAAYHDDVLNLKVKFGKGTAEQPGVKDILWDPAKPYSSSDVFRLMEGVDTNAMVVAFEDDDVVNENPETYFKHLVRGLFERALTSGGRNVQFHVLPGGHIRSFEDPERIKLLLPRFVQFVTS